MGANGGRPLWPDCLRDSRNFWERVKSRAYAPNAPEKRAMYRWFTFYKRWLITCRGDYSAIFSPIWWLYTIPMAAALVLIKFLFLNPPWFPWGRVRRQYDIQMPIDICRSPNVQDGKTKALREGNSTEEFWRWFLTYFAHAKGRLPAVVRRRKFSIFKVMPDHFLWFEQVNIPLPFGLHYKLPPLSGIAECEIGGQMSMSIDFPWWGPHWATGSVVTSPHPDGDLDNCIWFRASFEVWPFLIPVYDFIVARATELYLNQLLEIQREVLPDSAAARCQPVYSYHHPVSRYHRETRIADESNGGVLVKPFFH